MLWLREHTAQIQQLIEDGTAESLTFAALRCRLAIEQVCYERLRNVHEYISPADLAKWQPAKVVTQLIQEVDTHVASSFTISVSTQPVPDDASELTAAEYEALDYVELGQQVGFDPKRLNALWQALSNFLHVRLPKGHTDSLAFFGDPEAIRRKVLEALSELQRLEKGTLLGSGIGSPATVSFSCVCGVDNRRRIARLSDVQVVNCINPDCDEMWTVRIEDSSIGFERRSMDVTCHACGSVTKFGEKRLLALKRNQMMRFDCRHCGVTNHLLWKLMHMKRTDEGGEASA